MKFRTGINYWPAAKAMHWWRRFDAGEVRADFERIRAAGFDSVRIFLLWEDFQPLPGEVSERSLYRLLQVARIAGESRVSLIVTLFTGHMSGVNWLPAWALERGRRSPRFRVVSEGCRGEGAPRNWYSDRGIRRAQALLAREVARAVSKHPALWAYDLGNENSNCVEPPSREEGIAWLEEMVSAIRSEDSSHPITLGLHAEDLEEDRRLGPAEAARVCDFLSMHAYPMYLSWAGSVDDEEIPAFLGLVTGWLGGREVLLEEFGAPAATPSPPTGVVPILGEEQAARFTGRALAAIHEAGLSGAMLWCYADYAASLWADPPLDEAPHERYFGLWRGDHSPKPALAHLRAFSSLPRREPLSMDWIDSRPEDFYRAPAANLRRLYGRFREFRAREGVLC